MLDVLEPPEEPDVVILVTPLLRPFNNPLMESVGEAVEFFRQVFEVSHMHSSLPLSPHDRSFQGLQFMHQCQVAHRYVVQSSVTM